MRVAMLNRGLHSHPGGDLVQVEETALALRRQGVWTHVESEDPQLHRPHLSSVDLAHITHVNFGFSKANWQWCKQAGVPYVVTPTYYVADQMGMTYAEQRQMLEEAAAVTPFTEKEAELITKCTHFEGPYRIIPNGTNRRFHRILILLDRTGVLAVAARAGTKGTGIVQELCDELGYPFTLATGVLQGRDAPTVQVTQGVCPRGRP